MSQKSIQDFGGDWSELKLQVVREYLAAYTLALKNQPFNLLYIDAFAGSGIREINEEIGNNEELFGVQKEGDDRRGRHGSPLVALEINPPFDEYIFIERDADSIGRLQKQIEELYGSSKKVKYLRGDSNEELKGVFQKDWNFNDRAVAFLDPFALQVKWTTLETMAATRGVDLLLLFPAMAVNRMLPRSGEIPLAWADKLTDLFGEEDWMEAFYQKAEPDLFGEETASKVDKVFEALSGYFTKRLGSIFAGTHNKPLILRNRTGAPLFLLCFACANPRGAGIATRIANHIINTSRHGQ